MKVYQYENKEIYEYGIIKYMLKIKYIGPFPNGTVEKDIPKYIINIFQCQLLEPGPARWTYEPVNLFLG